MTVCLFAWDLCTAQNCTECDRESARPGFLHKVRIRTECGSVQKNATRSLSAQSANTHRVRICKKNRPGFLHKVRIRIECGSVQTKMQPGRFLHKVRIRTECGSAQKNATRSLSARSATTHRVRSCTKKCNPGTGIEKSADYFRTAQ